MPTILEENERLKQEAQASGYVPWAPKPIGSAAFTKDDGMWQLIQKLQQQTPEHKAKNKGKPQKRSLHLSAKSLRIREHNKKSAGGWGVLDSILRFVLEAGAYGATTSEVAAALNITTPSVAAALSKFRARGKLKYAMVSRRVHVIRDGKKVVVGVEETK